MKEIKSDTFGARLDELCRSRNVSKIKLAEEIGRTRTAVDSWVHGTKVPSADAVKACAEYFSVSADFLLGLSRISTRDDFLFEVNNRLGLVEQTAKFLEQAHGEPVLSPSFDTLQAINFLPSNEHGKALLQGIGEMLRSYWSTEKAQDDRDLLQFKLTKQLTNFLTQFEAERKETASYKLHKGADK